MLWPLGGVAFVQPPQRPGAVLWSIAAGPLVRSGGDTWHFLFAPTGLASQRPWGLARTEWRGWGGCWWAAHCCPS